MNIRGRFNFYSNHRLFLPAYDMVQHDCIEELHAIDLRLLKLATELADLVNRHRKRPASKRLSDTLKCVWEASKAIGKAKDRIQQLR